MPLLITFNKTWKLTRHQIQDFSPNFPVKKFYLNGPFVQLFEPIAPKSAELPVYGKAGTLRDVR